MKCFLLPLKSAPYVGEMFIEERIHRTTANDRGALHGH